MNLQSQELTQGVRNNTKWIKFGEATTNIHFVGKDVVAIADGLHIIFFDLTTNTDVIYKADSEQCGSGVNCLAGYKLTPMFAFAEKCYKPRIFIMEYPNFTVITTLKDKKGPQILALTFAEMEYIFALSSLPDYEIAIWSWKSGDKLASQKTGIVSLKQSFRCSPISPPVICQMAEDSKEIVFWEVHTCCKKCLLTRLDFDIDTATPPCRFTWSPDGILIVIDSAGLFFMIEIDKRRLQYIFSWTGGYCELIPIVSWYKGGIVVSGPDGAVKHFKRTGATEWDITFSVFPEVNFSTIATCIGKDHLIAFTEQGNLMQFKMEDEGPRFLNLAAYGRNYIEMCFINPVGEYFATLSKDGYVNIWDIETGLMEGQMEWNEKCLVMTSNPVFPYFALGRADGVLDFINAFLPDKPNLMTQIILCHDGISGLEISQNGSHVFPCIKEKGIFFVIKSDPGIRMEVKGHKDIGEHIGQFTIYEDEKEALLLALSVTRLCCDSGDKLWIYSVKYMHYEFTKKAYIHLPGLYVGFFLKPMADNEFYGIPHQSKVIYILRVNYEKETLELIDAKSSGHQIKKYTISTSDDEVSTYSFDGMVILHSLRTFESKASIATHHYTDLGIKKALKHHMNSYALALGHDGSLVCSSLRIEIDTQKSIMIKKSMTEPHLVQSFTVKKTTGFAITAGPKETKTWFELQEDIKTIQETAMYSKEKATIQDQFNAIQRECVKLLEQNYNCTPEEQLPVSEFDLDEATRARRTEETKRICKETEIHLKALIAAQNSLCDILKKRFWDPVEIKGGKLRAIMEKGEVESYPVYSPNKKFEEEWTWIMERRNLEVLMQNEDSFRPWESTRHELEDELTTELTVRSARQSSIVAHPVASANIRDVLSNNTLFDMVEEEEKLIRVSLSGSTSHEFIELSQNHHNQFEMTTYIQMRNEIILLMKVTNDLREYFNERFNEIMSIKEREMVLVAERNARLRYVLSELNDMETIVTDPTWAQDEQPERIMKVEQDEVPVTPYISPSEQEILNKLAAEAEAIRLALLADNFRELALIVMMDGVLELRWEDEIKKDIPKPKCMLEKDPAEFNEEDLKIIKDYEEKVAFRLSERERYRKMLEAEFIKLSQTLKESVMKFNDRLADLFLLKLKVEAAIGQENLKIIRAKSQVSTLSSINRKVKNLKRHIRGKETEIAALQETIHRLNNWTNDCRDTYEAQVAKEKNLEKNFKKDFPDVSQVVFEQLTKFYKRRPKMHQKALMSVTLLNELSRCTMTTDRPSFLPPDYIDFLKGLDQIDNYSNSPPVINEEVWNTLCRVRRQKVECELKVRSFAVEVAESEQTLSIYQKRLAAEKQNLAALHEDLQKAKTELLDIFHNTEIQVVMKGGLVEVKTTGAILDFQDAVLITREKVESINELVKKAGKQKLSAIHRLASFRRGILAKEWEHKKLKMEIQDLEEHLHNLESMKVTKDIQMFLRRKVQGMSEEKFIMSIEREVALLKESYEATIKELQDKMDELDKKITMQSKANRELDNKITAVNVDVSEQQLQRDMEYETKQSEAMKERMASVVKRTQLVALIQKQHNEILALQTELELLRLKTYPTLKYKTLI